MGTKWVRNSKNSLSRADGSEPRPARTELPTKGAISRYIATTRAPAVIVPAQINVVSRSHVRPLQQSDPQLLAPQRERPRRTTECSEYFATIQNYGTDHPLVQSILINWNRRPSPNSAQSPRSSQTSHSSEISRPATARCDGLADWSRPIVISPPLPPVLLVEVSSIDSCLRLEAGIQIHNEDGRSKRNELT